MPRAHHGTTNHSVSTSFCRYEEIAKAKPKANRAAFAEGSLTSLGALVTEARYQRTVSAKARWYRLAIARFPDDRQNHGCADLVRTALFALVADLGALLADV